MADEDNPKNTASKLQELAKSLGIETPVGGIGAPNLTAEVVGRFVNEHLENRMDSSWKKLRDIEVFVATIEERFNGLSRDLMDSEDKIEKINRTVGDPAAALENFKAAVVEELKLKEARKLWTDSANRAWKAYAVSWLILVMLLVGVPLIAIMNSQAIFQFFHTLSEAVLVDLPPNATETAVLIAAVSRLVLVTLPVALFIWLIRIVVRFNMRSLLLMDDARQRNTMLETYLHLVEQDKDVKADRPLVLEALFRRTPGHGPDTIEPPNLADVLKLGNLTSSKSG